MRALTGLWARCRVSIDSVIQRVAAVGPRLLLCKGRRESNGRSESSEGPAFITTRSFDSSQADAMFPVAARQELAQTVWSDCYMLVVLGTRDAQRAASSTPVVRTVIVREFDAMD